MPKSPTIYDVAKAAGVAPSTVSRAFSRPGRLRAATVEHVRSVAADLGYRISPVSPTAVAEGNRLIALVVPDITNPFYLEIIRGVEATASAHGYTLVLADTQESHLREQEALGRVMPTVAGLLLAGTRLSDAAIVTAAREKPLVVLNRSVAEVPSVVTDNPAGARRAVEHLWGFGHRTMTYVAGPEASWADGIRWRSVHDAGSSHRLSVRLLGPFAPTVEAGMYAAKVLADNPSSSVVCYNDQLAIGLMRGLRQLGARVPDDVSVVGFDNTLVADLVSPGLTTVAAPLGRLGATGVESLMACIGGAPNRASGTVVLPTQLVVRDSTGPPSASASFRTHEVASDDTEMPA